MNIVAISGSIREGSYNTALLHAAAALSPDTLEINVNNSLGELPIFAPEAGDVPKAVDELMSTVRMADGVIMSTPEYAHGVSGVLKNALDWFVASDALVLKPVVVMSVSTSALGGARGHSSLLLTLSAMNARVVSDGSLTVPFARNRFNSELELVDEITRDALNVSLAALARAIEA